jgi:Tfp pilus assembly protein PilV
LRDGFSVLPWPKLAPGVLFSGLTPPIALFRAEDMFRGRGSQVIVAQRAIGLIEVMVAVTILVVVVFGAVSFMVNGRLAVERGNQQRVAAQVGLQKLEEVRSRKYADVTAGTTWGTTSVKYGATSAANVTLWWRLDVTAGVVDAPNSSDVYKTVQITVSRRLYNASNTVPTNPVILTTAISP